MTGVLLHVWSPEPEAASRQEPTWAALPALHRALGRAALLSVPTPRADPLAYAAAIAAARDLVVRSGGPLIVLEGDKEPTPGMLGDLAACPHDLCAQAYRIYPCTTGLHEPVYAQQLVTTVAPWWIEEGAPWAEATGLGLVKIGPGLLPRLPEGEPFAGDFDWRIIRPLGARVHVHWPEMPHHHTH